MSIALTTPFTVSLNGVQIENDVTGACTGWTIDAVALTMTYYFSFGTLSGSPQNLVPGPQAQLQGKNIQVTVSLVSPYPWYASTGASGSSIPGSIMNPIISQLLSGRNSAEGFVAVSGGLMPGTTTAWTQF